jgi:hypothetical protein
MPSQAEIRCECAFTYMNAVSRKNLTDARAVDANDVDTASENRRRIRRWQEQSAVLPDDSDIHLGRERPLRAGRGAKKGAAKWGSLTPH